jgi:hypothetical protein
MSNDPKAGPGIDAALLAAYIDQRLSPEQRAAVEARLASDPESYELLVETMRAQDAIDASGQTLPMPSPRRRRWILPVGLAAAAVLVLAVWSAPQVLRIWGGEEDQLAALIVATRGERTVEARLSGGFEYGPLRSVTRGSKTGENLELLAAAADAQQRANDGPRHRHAWAIAQLLVGDYTEAVSTLEALAAEQPSNADLWNDLAAAYLARAQREKRLEDLPKARIAVERSLAVTPTKTESLFNHAAILSALDLAEQAKAAWTRYLEVDATSGWATEARQRLQELTQPPRAVNRPTTAVFL